MDVTRLHYHTSNLNVENALCVCVRSYVQVLVLNRDQYF